MYIIYGSTVKWTSVSSMVQNYKVVNWPFITKVTNELIFWPVLIGNLFQLHEDSHDRRLRGASHYHYLIIYDI